METNKENNAQMAIFAAVAIAVVLLILSFGCTGQTAATAEGQQTATPAYSNYVPPENGSQQAAGAKPSGTRLTLIKFHGNSQCISCINLGKFANSTLERNFQTELAGGNVKYLNINAEADSANPYVQKYRPNHASLYLLTENEDGEKYEELVEAWYYTGDEAKYQQYLAGLLRTRLGG